jgi:hypothetical protein
VRPYARDDTRFRADSSLNGARFARSHDDPGVAPPLRYVYVPTMRRTLTCRAFALLWAVLQFALPSVAMLADVRLERDSLEAPGAHVESGSTKACHPVHPDQCALCQVLSRTAPPGEATALPAIAAIVRPSATLPIARLATRAAATAELPRAPPTTV